MKRCVLVALVACFLVVASVGRPVRGYNPGGHVYIAEHALFTLSSNALYGSIAPDIIGYLPAPWAGLLEDIHVYFNLVPKAVTLPEKMFAIGWMTHNGVWGADSFTHEPGPAYAVEKGLLLVDALGSELPDDMPFELKLGLGHIATEMAVDILLKRHDPLLAMKVYQAAALRSNSIPRFLWHSGAIPDKELATEGESFFRKTIQQYALALGMTTTQDLDAMAEYASKMASEIYGVSIGKEQATGILALAIYLCKDDYLVPINQAIPQIRYKVWHGEF